MPISQKTGNMVLVNTGDNAWYNGNASSKQWAVDLGIGDVYANPYGAVARTAVLQLPVMDIMFGLGLYKSTTALVGSLSMISSAAATATVATGLGIGAKFESEHYWLNSDFNNLMTNPFIPRAKKEQMMLQMQSDSLLQQSGIDAPVVKTFHITPRTEEQLSFPTLAHHHTPQLSFPDQSDYLMWLLNSRGFGDSRPRQLPTATEGFDTLSQDSQPTGFGDLSKPISLEDMVLQMATKDPEWNIRPGQEWKAKIYGKGQRTGTSGHATESYKEAIRAAKREDVTAVFLDRGISNRVLGVKKGDPAYITPNRRPDITIVYKDGTIQQIEVGSKSDFRDALRARMRDTRSKLPKERRGDVDVNDILMKKYGK